jgi:hypothetical protein
MMISKLSNPNFGDISLPGNDEVKDVVLLNKYYDLVRLDLDELKWFKFKNIHSSVRHHRPQVSYSHFISNGHTLFMFYQYSGVHAIHLYNGEYEYLSKNILARVDGSQVYYGAGDKEVIIVGGADEDQMPIYQCEAYDIQN